MLGGFFDTKLMTREAQLMTGEKTVYCGHALLDTGANQGSYIGEAMVVELPDLLREPCVHSVKLGDGATLVYIKEFVTIDVALYDDDCHLCDSIATEFYIMPHLGKQIIIGPPDLLGNYYDYFTTILERSRLRKPAVRLERLQQLYGLCRELLCTTPESERNHSDPSGSTRFGPKSPVSERSQSDLSDSTQKQLKIKKSFIGVDTVTFFGYEVSHGKWKLSEARKDSIDALPFPQSRKEMQSFLGAALFFHNHIADYSQWAAKLYEMTHDSFSWDPTTWSFDYRGHFDHFKTSIRQACTLHFPRYDLPWVIRCDASEHAVGAVLFQILTLEDGTVDHQPIAFSSKRFSEPA